MTSRTPKTPAAVPRGTRPPCDPPLSPAAKDGQGTRLPGEVVIPGAPQAGPDTPGAAAAGPGGQGCSRLPGINPVAGAMSENELEQHIRRILADLPSVLAYHTHDSRHSASGYPDWTFVGPRGVLFRELKREGRKPTPAQAAWLTALVLAGQDAAVWRPSDLLAGRVGRRLAKLAGLPVALEVTG